MLLRYPGIYTPCRIHSLKFRKPRTVYHGCRYRYYTAVFSGFFNESLAENVLIAGFCNQSFAWFIRIKGRYRVKLIGFFFRRFITPAFLCLYMYAKWAFYEFGLFQNIYERRYIMPVYGPVILHSQLFKYNTVKHRVL